MTKSLQEPSTGALEVRESHHAPVLVLAPPQSGSTVTTMMLGEHPELYGFPELRLFEDEHVDGVLRAEPGIPQELQHYRRSGVLRALAQVHEESQTNEAITRADRWLTERLGWRCDALFDYLLDAITPRIGVENSPETASTAASLQRAVRAYPRARLIHLVRHPASAIRSIAHLRSGPKHFVHLWSASLWLSTHARLFDIERILGAEQAYRLRAEDVINRPRPSLRRLAHWLGVSEADDAIEKMMHPENSSYASVGPSLAPGGGDAGFLESPRLRRMEELDSLEFPAEWNLNRNVVEGIVALAREFGYGPDAESA